MSDGLFFEDLSVGQTASFGKTITEADIVLFAAVTGDTNPMHLNADYARTSVFGERIAHGMLAASFGKTITEADIVLFAAVTGDTNPMHLNADYARTSVFGERIAHGMLAA